MTRHQIPSHTSTHPVLVVVPCLNEERHIEAVLRGLIAEADHCPMRIVVADGGSTDATRSIVRRFADRDKRIVLIDNPKRIQSAGINLAVRAYGDQAMSLVRLDAHAEYPNRYCQHLLEVQAKTSADSVVVSMRTKGKTCFQRAAAAAQNSVLGNGGAAHRNPATDCWVDHGHHALMSIDAFRSVGGYDEAFAQVEDVELDIRLRAAGFRIFLTSEAAVTYYPRRSLPSLFLQYFRVGRCRARNFLKHRKEAKLRHLLLALPAPAIVALAASPMYPILVIPVLAWTLLCLGYGLFLGIRFRDPCASAAGVTAVTSQAAWSLGFWRELVSKTLQKTGSGGGRGGSLETAADCSQDGYESR